MIEHNPNTQGRSVSILGNTLFFLCTASVIGYGGYAIYQKFILLNQQNNKKEQETYDSQMQSMNRKLFTNSTAFTEHNALCHKLSDAQKNIVEITNVVVNNEKNACIIQFIEPVKKNVKAIYFITKEYSFDGKLISTNREWFKDHAAWEHENQENFNKMLKELNNDDELKKARDKLEK